jgi:hypothetical protein
MGYLVCNKCGVCFELKEGESTDDFYLTCECGGKFKYKESTNSYNKSDLDKIKWILVFSGFVLILMFLARYFESKSPLDLFYLTMGILAIIWGFHVKDEFKGTATYFVAISCVNIAQWLILVYILFISKIYVTNDLFTLALAPIVTISLIIQIRTSDLKYIGNPQKTNKDVILADKLKKLLNNMGKIILKSLGILIILFCTVSFLFSRDPIELYGSLVGLMVFVYGYFRENKNVMPPNYAPGMYRKSIFVRESSKIKVTTDYFLAMLGVILAQWLFLVYIIGIYPNYPSTDNVAWAFTITTMITMYFYMQIRESDFKYIGRMRKLN